MALVVGAAGAHPAQAGVVEEAEVAPQGEVVAVAPAAADHLRQGRHRRLPRLLSHPGCLVSRVVPGQHLVGHPAGGALGDEVQIGQHRGPHRSRVDDPSGRASSARRVHSVNRQPHNAELRRQGLLSPTVGVSESAPGGNRS